MTQGSKSILACVVLAVAAFPAAVHAQASITGVVTDPSGGVLPGVTVEASSPALIERVQSVATDGGGQYRIVDLPVGTYTVTFSLSGFNRFQREGVELTGTFTASVNAQMRVGGLEETITVTAESPIVDVQGTKVQTTIDSQTISAIPNARQYFSFTALVPGLSIQGSDVGGSLGPTFSVFQAHGGKRNEGRLQVDGTEVAFLGVSFYVADTGAAQEIAVTVSGGMGEAVTGGPIMNVISRSGGNTFRGSLFGNFANNAMQGDNYTQALRDAGLRATNPMQRLWDTSAWYGGRIKRDRLWFFANARYQGNRNLIAGMWRNVNAGDPTSMDVCARPEPAGHRRRHVEKRGPAPDMAGDAAQQDRRLVGRAVLVPPMPGELGDRDERTGWHVDERSLSGGRRTNLVDVASDVAPAPGGQPQAAP